VDFQVGRSEAVEGLQAVVVAAGVDQEDVGVDGLESE